MKFPQFVTIVLVFVASSAICHVPIDKSNDERISITINGILYYISRNAETWENAKADCQVRNMDIACFETKSEWSGMVSYLKTSGEFLHDYWVGAVRHNDTSYAWDSNGQRVGDSSYVPWCSGRPLYTSPFALIDGFDQALFCLLDADNAANYYICEEI